MLQEKFRSLEEGFFSAVELKNFLEDDRLLHAVMLNINKQLDQLECQGDITDYISLLPKTLDKLSWQGQETAATLYRKLPCWEFPVWRAEDVPEFVQVAWCQAELCAGRVDCYSQVSWPIFCKAYRAFNWCEVRHPDLLWQALHEIQSEKISDIILSNIENIIDSSALPYNILFQFVLKQLRSRSLTTVYTALQSLKQTWCLLFECPTNILEPLLESYNDAIAINALELLFFWGEVGGLELHLNSQRIEFSNCLLVLFKDHAQYQHVTLLLDFVKQDFAAFSRSVIECLSTITLKGQRIANKHLSSIFTLAAYREDGQDEKIAFIIGDRWEKWQALLEGLSYDDQAWTSQLELIQCVDDPAAEQYLVQLLNNPELHTIHEHMLRILSHKGNPMMAKTVFRFFDQYPQTVLQGLRPIITPEIRRQLQVRYQSGLPSTINDDVGQFLQNTQLDIDYSVSSNGVMQTYLKQLQFNHDSSGFDFLEQQLGMAEVSTYITYCKNIYFLPILSKLLLHDDEEVKLSVIQAIKEIAFILFDSESIVEPSIVKADNRETAGDYLLSTCIIGQLNTANLHELKPQFRIISAFPELRFEWLHDYKT
ncbi:hypothetical protein MNBD_GAMMA12-2710 [hydrothermal vent metagenome]|uniref:Uncharacterized protein n=1 Tax=hydrothermal vent metagenome TaxID=652676 RepID=A0A3B0YKS8_9ZZZZ